MKTPIHASRKVRQIRKAVDPELSGENEERRLRQASAGLTQRVVELQKANGEVQDARRAALNVMEDAIQARQRAEALNLQLRDEIAVRIQAEERFRNLADNISQMAWMCDRIGEVTWYNRRWLDYTGLTSEETTGWGWTQCLHPDHLDRVVAGARHSQDTGQSWEDTFPLRGKDGNYRWFLSRAVPIRDAQGQIIRWFGTNTDITERRQVEEALRESREELSKRAQLLDLSPEPIIVRSLEDKIVYWNKGAERLYGWTAEEAFGKNIHDLLRTRFPESLSRALERLYSHGYWEGELDQTARDGSNVVVVAHWVLQRDGNERPISILDTKFDITERKQMEVALRTAEKLASVGRMAATLAHEINNPLEALTNFIYLAQKEPAVPESVQKLLASADEELARVGYMTKQTLGLYRESKAPQPVLMSDLLSWLLSMFSQKIKTRQITTDLKVINEVEVLGVQGELRQVFSNLLSNSIDAVGPHGTIQLRVTEAHAASNGRNSGVRVTIADNGPGIPAANLRKIFEPFFTTKQDVGTGLGLWVSKEIVKQHGGSIRLRSCAEPGKTWTVASVFVPDSPPQQGRKPE
ncbi:MAG: PAS domain S-box protein [Acidobacteriaceae bacterium]